MNKIMLRLDKKTIDKIKVILSNTNNSSPESLLITLINQEYSLLTKKKRIF